MNANKTKFGIIGAGMIAEFHAQAIASMADAELTAIYTRRKEQADDFASRHDCNAYAHLDDVLKSADVDVVTICTPSGAHMEPTLAAAALGKHVICEKPLDVSTARIDRMIAACDEAGVMLAGIFPRRFNPATALLKSAVDAGRFGTIVLADAIVKWWRPQAYYDSGAWRGTWDLDGGGALMNQSIHTIDLLLHIAGGVKAVQARTRLAAHERIEVEDVGVAMLEFANGAHGVIQGSTACWSSTGLPAEIQISGSAGSVIMSDDKFRVWDFRDSAPEDDDIRAHHGLETAVAGAGAADPKAIDYSWHQRNFEDAVAALRAGRMPSVDGHQARRAVALIEAIYQSARNGGDRVEIG